MADSTLALRDLVETLSRLARVHAHLCDGDPRSAVTWSEATEITVRLFAAADDELWVLAGSGILAREVADSEGGFDLEPLVCAILEGRAVELFGPATRHDALTPRGWQVTLADGSAYAADTNGGAVIVTAITGPLTRASDG